MFIRKTILENNIDSEITSQIKQFISKEFLIEFTGEFDATTDLMATEVIDSFGFIELITYIEQEHNISLDEDDLSTPGIVSVTGIAQLIESKNA